MNRNNYLPILVFSVCLHFSLFVEASKAPTISQGKPKSILELKLTQNEHIAKKQPDILVKLINQSQQKSKLLKV